MMLYLNIFFSLPQKQKKEATEQYIEKAEPYQPLKNHIQNAILNKKVCVLHFGPGYQLM